MSGVRAGSNPIAAAMAFGSSQIQFLFGALSGMIRLGLGEGAGFLHCHLLPFIGIPCVKKTKK